MGRKNRRKKMKHEGRLGFNPRKYIHKTDPRSYGTRPRAYESGLRAYEPAANAAYLPVASNEDFSALKPNDVLKPMHYDVWLADLGGHKGTSVQSGIRPVVIISNDRSNSYASTVTVIPMTSKQKRLDIPAHVWVEDDKNGSFQGTLLTEQITTIPMDSLRYRIGELDNREYIEKLGTAICFQLGIGAQLATSTQLATSIQVIPRNDMLPNTENENKEEESDDKWQQ